jgi:hypothetical protein
MRIITYGNNVWGSGFVRFFPWDPRLTSSGKKFVDMARDILVNQSRYSIDESHFLPRGFISTPWFCQVSPDSVFRDAEFVNEEGFTTVFQ